MKHRVEGEIGFVTGNWPLDASQLTLLFIHGAGTSHLVWESQVNALLPYANTIAIDLPGHGSSQGKGRDTIADYAQAVIDFIELAGIPHPLPCGLSMGGAITLHLLIHNPRRYSKGILVNTGAKLKVLPMIFETIERSYDDYLKMSCTFAISKKNDSKGLRRKVRASSQCRPEIALNDFRTCNAFNVMGQLSSIDVPILVLTASDDIITPPKYGIYLAENIKDAYRVNIEDAGHLSPIEKPDEVNKAIHDFLNWQAQE